MSLGVVYLIAVKIALFMANSLQHKTILVTRSAGQSSQFTRLLEAQGATVVELPALEIGPPSSWVPLDKAIARLHQFHWLILTSANGVEAFFNRLHLRLEVLENFYRQHFNFKIAVVGKKTAIVLKHHGCEPDFIPPNFVADSLVEHFPDRLTNTQILFPRVESGGRDVLVQQFTTQGAIVTEVPAYESRCPVSIAPQALEALQKHQVDVVTFASSKTVKNFCELLKQSLGENWLEYLNDVVIASIGPQTSQTCEAVLGRVDLEAQEYTLEGLTDAIVDRFQNA